MDGYRSDPDMLEVEDLLLPGIFASQPMPSDSTAEAANPAELEQLQKDAEKAIDIMMALLNAHGAKISSLLMQMLERKEKISALIAEFRAELARLKIIQIRIQLLVEIEREPARGSHHLAQKQAAMDTAESLIEELVELEDRLRQRVENRPTSGLKERLEDIKSAMLKVFRDLRL